MKSFEQERLNLNRADDDSQMETPVRFSDLDWPRVDEMTQGASFKLSAVSWYVLGIWLSTIVEAAFFLFEVVVLVFLLPVYGVADSRFPRINSEYSVPYGWVRYVVIFCLSMLMFLKVAIDFLGRGLMSETSIARTMANPLKQRLVSLKSYQKYKVMYFLVGNSNLFERTLGWVVSCAQGWKRFIAIKTPLCIMYALTTYGAATIVYEPINVQLQNVAIVYMSLRFAAYAWELLYKFAALMTYGVMIMKGNLAVSNSVSDKYADLIAARVKKLTVNYMMGDFSLQTSCVPNQLQDHLDDSVISKSNRGGNKEEFQSLELNSPLLTSPNSNTQKKSPNRVRFERTFSGRRGK